MYAADYRAAARRFLTGNWALAVVAGLIYGLFGGGYVPLVEYTASTTTSFPQLRLLIFTIPLEHWFFFNRTLMLPIILIFGILGCVVETGYAAFNLELADGRAADLYTLFDYITHIPTLLCARLLTILYVVLWSLLFVIPGIYAFYGYAMVPYVLAENPHLSANEAISRSKELMSGNRWRLFCLQVSFMGWNILSAVTLGFGYLFLNPYYAAAEAAFYRSLTGTRFVRDDIMDF